MEKGNQSLQFELCFSASHAERPGSVRLLQSALNGNAQPGVFIKPTWEDFEVDVERMCFELSKGKYV